jgi:molybdenum cofactor cytidylyltransferase
MEKRLVAFILAAGFSSRMGTFKPLLPLGDTFVLEHSVTLFRNAGINDIRVVTGYRSFELDPVLRELGVQIIKNPRFEEGMFSSVQTAVKNLGGTADAFFILPVDIPLVRPTTIHALIDTFQEKAPAVTYPCFLKERGHPPLISSLLVDDILRWQGNGGLKAVLSIWEGGAMDVEVPDENILFDMDQDEDYRLMKEKSKALDIPSEEECRALLLIFKAEDKILRHGQAVANTAIKLGEDLNNAGCRLNIPLLMAGSLLHDIAKGQSKNHAEKGAEIIRLWGYPAVAEIVAAHTDIDLKEGAPIREKEILYLADKLVRGEETVTLQERFRAAQERYSYNPEISKNVERRLRDALTIQERVESIVGSAMGKALEYDGCRTSRTM